MYLGCTDAGISKLPHEVVAIFSKEGVYPVGGKRIHRSSQDRKAGYSGKRMIVELAI
ncbi:hypothetical protein D3C72_2436450 [compost metagenome]